MDKQLEAYAEQQNLATQELTDRQMKTGQVYNKLERLQNDLQRQHDEKALNIVNISTKQDLLKNLQALQQNKLRLISKSIEQTKDLIMGERTRAQNLQNICDRLSEDYPIIAPSIRSVARTLHNALESSGQQPSQPEAET